MSLLPEIFPVLHRGHGHSGPARGDLEATLFPQWNGTLPTPILGCSFACLGLYESNSFSTPYHPLLH